MTDTPRTDEFNSQKSNGFYEAVDFARSLERENARLALDLDNAKFMAQNSARMAQSFENRAIKAEAELTQARHIVGPIDYSDKGVFDALLLDNARLAAELADFKRTEPLKVDERNQWRDKAKRLEVELDDARDACKAVWPFIEFHVGCVGHIKGFQEALDKVKAQVSK